MNCRKEIKNGETKTFLKFLFRFINVLPHRAALGLGALSGWLFWALSKRKVDRAEARCVSALGVGVTLARDIVRASYVNVGKSAAEFARLERLAPRLASLALIEGKEHMDKAVARGKGVLIMTAHMGNWEIGGARMVAEGYAITPIFTPQRNVGGANDLVSDLRASAAGMEMIPSEGFGMREIFRALRKGKLLVFLQDLDARKKGVAVPFLGLPASTAAGIVKMYRKFGAPIVPVLCLRNPDGLTHTIRVHEILSDLTDEDGNLFGFDMEKSLKMCNNILAGWVTEYPEQWMWLLDRWESTAGAV
ncbi:MAG: lysophospholipid acyltransferase family protein [Synergistaceae bacterium]|nr:lysophospholipid acyltransferase family protein [Synergistaceae bacterium]